MRHLNNLAEALNKIPSNRESEPQLRDHVGVPCNGSGGLQNCAIGLGTARPIVNERACFRKPLLASTALLHSIYYEGLSYSFGQVFRHGSYDPR